MNQIRSLELDGTIFKDNSEKVWRQKIPRLDFSSIGEEDKQILEKQEIEKEEAQQVLRGRGETRPLSQMGSQWALPKILLGYKETMGPFQGIQ